MLLLKQALLERARKLLYDIDKNTTTEGGIGQEIDL